MRFSLVETRRPQRLLAGSDAPGSAAGALSTHGDVSGKDDHIVSASKQGGGARKSSSANVVNTRQTLRGVTIDERFSTRWQVAHEPVPARPLASNQKALASVPSWTVDELFKLPWTAAEGQPSLHFLARELSVDLVMALGVHKQRHKHCKALFCPCSLLHRPSFSKRAQDKRKKSDMYRGELVAKIFAEAKKRSVAV